MGGDGAVYLTGENRQIFALRAGALAYRFTTSGRILAQPALAGDQRLFVAAEDRTLYALAPDGAVRFQFRPPGGTFQTSPVLSPDEQQVYVAAKERALYAVHTQSGVQQWATMTAGDLLAGPAVDQAGYIHLGNTAGGYQIFTPAGKELSAFTGWAAITQRPALAADGRALVNTGGNTLRGLTLLPNRWDGRPDVQPTANRRVWRLANPVAIDTGADLLHRPLLGQESAITGQGVTVAVVDSGVQFSPEVKQELGAQLQRQFLGQADFVNRKCPRTGLLNLITIGTQYKEYCFLDANYSQDPYGHGSHVAGTIWNNYLDAATGASLGVAPGANILSVRIFGDRGSGAYADLIQGIQYVVEKKETFRIGVMNLSLSAYATTPYFIDPLNRAVEQAWARGIVVVAAAGNLGPGASTVTVPGNDPYVITVGALDSKRTPGYWADDALPTWSASGPTLDGFAKPDVVAPGSQIVSFMYNDPKNKANAAWLVQQHPDYAPGTSLYRMSGTSMATAVASGVVALMLQAQPQLTPDQVKFRLIYTARPALAEAGPAYNHFQQGAGRIWAPGAVLASDVPADGKANGNLDIQNELAHVCCQSWRERNGNGQVEADEVDPAELAWHYQGPVRRVALVETPPQSPPAWGEVKGGWSPIYSTSSTPMAASGRWASPRPKTGCGWTTKPFRVEI
jgi:subtilisin family serine protease